MWNALFLWDSFAFRRTFQYISYMKKSVKITIYVLISLCVVMVAGLILGANYMFAYALDSQFEQGALAEEEVEPLSEEEVSQDISQTAEEWLVATSQRETIISHDGLELVGYYRAAPAPTDKYALLVHGYKAGPTGMAHYARYYHDAGWNVVVPHHRAHGDSQGRYIGMGWLEHYDMLGWISRILAMEPDARILIHGVSMGAATTMLATGSANLPANVEAAIADCGYSNVTAEFTHQLKEIFGLPGFPLLPVTSLLTKLKANYSFDQVDCQAAVARSSTPTLFIHGDGDGFVPFEMLDVVYNAAACPKEKLVVSGAGHAKSRETNPELYWSTVNNFLSRFMN